MAKHGRSVLCVLAAAMLAAPMMGASPRNMRQPRSQNRTATAAVQGQKQEDINTPLTGVDEFVAKHLPTAILSRYYDSEKIPLITQELKTASNYDKIPPIIKH